MPQFRILAAVLLFLGLVLFPFISTGPEWTPKQLPLFESGLKGNGGFPTAQSSGFSLDMPIDHFNASDKRNFQNHYWLNDTFYKPGGPVFLFDMGIDHLYHILQLLG